MSEALGAKGTTAPMDQALDAIQGLRGLMLTTSQGEVIASKGDGAEHLERLASFLVGLGELGDRIAVESGSGDMNWFMLKASAGMLVVHQVGSEGDLLLGLADDQTSQGTMIHDLGWCARMLASSRT